jgi:hypothetical protein
MFFAPVKGPLKVRGMVRILEFPDTLSVATPSAHWLFWMVAFEPNDLGLEPVALSYNNANVPAARSHTKEHAFTDDSALLIVIAAPQTLAADLVSEKTNVKTCAAPLPVLGETESADT